MLPNNTNLEISEEESAEEGFDWWLKSEAFDNVLLRKKSKKSAKMYETLPKSPTIMIWNDQDVDDIEIAKIESYCDRMLTPEGNVKYKNYKVLAPTNAPIRMYSPSGDINTTPKKGKIMPKFEINESTIYREKLISLISDDLQFSDVLKAIIRPTGLSRQNVEALRRTNASRLDDYLQFMSSVNYTPSPSFSMFSDDTADYQKSPPVTPEFKKYPKKISRCCSVDKNDGAIMMPKFSRQMSVPNSGENCVMNLSDELSQAERYCMRSHTPNTMVSSDLYEFQRSVSSLSGNVALKSRPLESKKAILKSFIQRNMIVRSTNRDNLAKLALAIEEDNEEVDNDCAIVTSAHLIENRVTYMLEEIKELKESLLEIQDELQNDDAKVNCLIGQTKHLSKELGAVRFLDNVVALLNGNLEMVVERKDWPFFTPHSGHKRDPKVNLIV